jgi:hypothetical protein
MAFYAGVGALLGPKSEATHQGIIEVVSDRGSNKRVGTATQSGTTADHRPTYEIHLDPPKDAAINFPRPSIGRFILEDGEFKQVP